MILDDLAAYLATRGCGTVGTDLFKSSMPDAPDVDPALNVAVLRSYGGMPPAALPGSRTFSHALPTLEEPRVQVTVRDFDYQAAELRANRIYQALIAVQDAVLGTTAYRKIDALQNPFDAGRDTQQRTLFKFNVACLKELDTLP